MTIQAQAEGAEGASTGGITNPRLAAIVAAQGGAPPAPAGGQGAVVGTAKPAELEVDVGGAKRLVRVEDLVQAYVTRDQAEASRKAAETALAQASQFAGLKELGDRINGLSASKRAQLMQVLEGGDEPEPDTVERRVARALGADDGSSEHQSELAALREMVQRQEQALSILAGSHMEAVREKQAASLSATVDQLMASYPAFRGNPAAALMAKDSIMAQASARGADVEAVVKQAASKLTELATREETRRREELGVRPTMAPEIQKRVLTGPGLKAGAVRQAAMDFIRRTQQA